VPEEPSGVSAVFTDEEIEVLRTTPPEVVIANHLFHLLELAAVHLAASPPNLDEARLVIDAVGGVTHALEGRLGEPGPVISDGLAQVQLVYVRLSTTPTI
jgi:hypothetical protein